MTLRDRRLAMASLLVAGLTMNVASAEVYRWVDESGQVHYSDKAPARAADRVEFAPGSAGADSRRDARVRSQADAVRRAQECTAARQRRDDYLDAAELVERGPDGSQRRLDETERRAAIARAQADVARLCEDET